ncbi:hypothetical protein [Chryseobacterium sp. JV274]|uniref:hypothetical protein n=1 Tax=Chryseobacterium sp. JV274 TaxID=1932669 RepID=UPI00098584E2|nr:hypothetical protein [Chryseobacterium sp. JV274]
MSHQEKQRIFDRYAKEQGYEDWDHLQNDYELLFMTVDEFQYFMFEACDLVQQEQQKRIAENAKMRYPYEDKSHWIEKNSIINPENKIQ